jgi:hypothetical protein
MHVNFCQLLFDNNKIYRCKGGAETSKLLPSPSFNPKNVQFLFAYLARTS